MFRSIPAKNYLLNWKMFYQDQKLKRNCAYSPKDYLRFIRRTTEFETIDKRFDRSPDVKDNYLFDLTYSVKSFLLITNDKPLLNMKQVNQIKIISFHDFKNFFQK